jgi:hypothetical protein
LIEVAMMEREFNESLGNDSTLYIFQQKLPSETSYSFLEGIKNMRFPFRFNDDSGDVEYNSINRPVHLVNNR